MKTRPRIKAFNIIWADRPSVYTDTSNLKCKRRRLTEVIIQS